MTIGTSDLVLCVHPGYGKALRVQRPIPNGSVVLSLASEVIRIPEPTATSIQVGVDEHIDGTPTLYLNHSCEPNVFVDAGALAIVALRDLEPGEDIQFFYPANEWHMSVPFECTCGTKSCLGSISGAREMDDRVLSRYRLNDHIKVLRETRSADAEVEGVLRRYPGVARARVVRDPRGKVVAQVLPWGTYSVTADAGVMAEVAGVNLSEVRFLHDEIFVNEAYLRGGIVLREGAVVFDVGANIGMFSLFVEARCPSAQVYAFEPVPEVFAKLEQNVSERGLAARPFNFGLSDREQEVSFYFYPGVSIMSCRHDYTNWDNEVNLIKQYVANERTSGPAGREEHLAEVEELVARDFEFTERPCRLRTMSAVIDEGGVSTIDWLKIDAQRSELDVLRGIEPRHWPLVQQVSMEVHDEAGSPTEGRVKLIERLLADQGFRVTVEVEDMLRGTGRYAVYAVRPGYDNDPRPVVAAAGTARPIAPAQVARWLSGQLPAGLLPDQVIVVDALSPAAGD
jgi:FkbM family methyltransferase